MDSDITEQRYIISAENRNYQQITAEIAQGFGINPPSFLAKPWMMNIAWRAARLGSLITGKAPAIDKVAAQASTQTRNFDNSKIKAATSIEFKPISKTILEVCERLA